MSLLGVLGSWGALPDNNSLRGHETHTVLLFTLDTLEETCSHHFMEAVNLDFQFVAFLDALPMG